MLYSTLAKTLFRVVHGAPPDLSEGGAGCGLVLVADGVGGFDLCGTALRYAVSARKLPLAVRVIPWGHGFGAWHKDLTRTANRDAWGAKVAAEVLDFRERNPQAPVHLVGKSGGTGVIVKAMERLPETAVDSAILIAPALSPRYDLTRALEAVRKEMVVFWSPFDVIILGAGTRVFGTIDRVRSVSAGMVGFQLPEVPTEARRRRYAKLRQVRWAPRMAWTGYLGGHLGPDNPAFLGRYVVPLLRGRDIGVEGNPRRDQADREAGR
jgi:pimeloyl-ACP methyl ester carboxylesterase